MVAKIGRSGNENLSDSAHDALEKEVQRIEELVRSVLSPFASF